MNIIRRVITGLGSICLAALLIAALAPKAAHAVVAALVDVTNTRSNPVPVDAVRRSAANFVTLFFNGSNWVEVLPDGSFGAAFTVPAGEQFVITDVGLTAFCFNGFNFTCTLSAGSDVQMTLGNFYIASDIYQPGTVLGITAGHTEHFAGGIVVSSIPTPGFFDGAEGGEFIGTGTIQGYLAP